MTDRELLELAAKAAGFSLVWGDKWNVGGDLIDCTDTPYIRSGQPDESDVYWNPLTDDGDGLWLAKDRSGKLAAWEAPDLSAIIAKIGGQS